MFATDNMARQHEIVDAFEDLVGVGRLPQIATCSLGKLGGATLTAA